MEERFLHRLRYTLINLLKPARPVSSTLTHQKSQAFLNPTGIFSMDASGKSLQPHSWQLSVRVCRNAYKVETNIHLIICHDECWVGRQLSEGVMKPLKQSGCWFVLPARILCLLDNRLFRSQQMKQFMVRSVLLALPQAMAVIFTNTSDKRVTVVFCLFDSLSLLELL